MPFNNLIAEMRFDSKSIARGASYKALCLAPSLGTWSLDRLKIEGDQATDADFISLFLGVLSYLNPAGSGKVYAPNTSLPTARVSHPEKFSRKIVVGARTVIHTNPDYPTEGTWPEPDEFVVYPTGGCPILVFEGGGQLCVAHAGRDSLVDRERIKTGKKSREHESVIHAVVHEFRERGITGPGTIRVHGFFGLPPRAFDHSRDHEIYGTINQRMAEELNVPGRKPVIAHSKKAGTEVFDLGALVHNQCEDIPEIAHVRYDFSLERVGSHAYTKHPIEHLRDKRNLAAIARFN